MLEGFTPAPIDTFGSRCTLIDRSDLGVGLSPDCANVEFFPGGCSSRVGFVERAHTIGTALRFTSLAQFTASPSFVRQRLLLSDSGTLWKETGEYPSVTLAQIATGLGEHMMMKAARYGNRLFIAFSNGLTGMARVRCWDGTTLDPASMGEIYASVELYGTGSGNYRRFCQVAETRNAYLSPPSLPALPSDVGSTITSIQRVSPFTLTTDVTRRRIYTTLGFTTAASTDFVFFTHPDLWIENAEDTSRTCSVTDDDLRGFASQDVSGTLIWSGIRPLPQCVGLVTYASRLIAWGVAHVIPRVNPNYAPAEGGPVSNMSFDGGEYWDQGAGNHIPNAWNGANTALVDDIPGSCRWAMKFVVPPGGGNSDMATSTNDVSKYAIQEPSPTGWYNVRVRARKSYDDPDPTLTAGNLRIQVIGATPFTITVGQLTKDWQWFTGSFFKASPGLVGTGFVTAQVQGGSPGGAWAAVDELQIFPSTRSDDLSTLYCSEFNDPETFVYGFGELPVSQNDGQRITNAYEIRGVLRVAKEHSIYSVTDTGGTPDTWHVEVASSTIGALGPWAVGMGDGWAILADSDGVFLDTGGIPQKLSQEIQPDWDQVNIAYGHLVRVAVDTAAKRIYVLYPKLPATGLTDMLVMDYVEGFGDPVSGQGQGRKWTSWRTPQINDMAYALLDSGQSAMLFAGGQQTTVGWVLMQDPAGAATSDTYYDAGEGAVTSFPIDAYYETATVGADQGRSLFGYLTARVRGAGSLTAEVVLPDGIRTALPPRVLSSSSPHDVEFPLHTTAVQLGVRIGTYGVRDRFVVRRLSLFAKAAPFSIVRGHNK